MAFLRRTLVFLVPGVFLLFGVVLHLSAPKAGGRIRGTWYLAANPRNDGTERKVARLQLKISSSEASESLSASIVNEHGGIEPVSHLSWDGSEGRLRFRRDGSGFSQWYRLRVVEGVLKGRFSHHMFEAGAEPKNPHEYSRHVTGWRSETFSSGLFPRSFQLEFESGHSAKLRFDRMGQGAAGVRGSFKVHALDGRSHETAEYPVEITAWTGKRLSARILSPQGAVSLSARVRGREVQGEAKTPVAGGEVPTGGFRGHRTEVLSYGLRRKTVEERRNWQEKNRKRLELLMMDSSPAPSGELLGVKKEALHEGVLAGFAGSDYSVSRVSLTYRIGSHPPPRGIKRRVHGYLAVPARAAGRARKPMPAVIALNGHFGSAWKVMNPESSLYGFGPSFARRSHVVFALDVSHRPPPARRGLYRWFQRGDDPARGNPARPAIGEPERDSAWEEDGERAWDVMRAADYLSSLPFIASDRILVAGLSMGGEVAAWAAALDPRLSAAVVAGFAPDFDVIRYRPKDNHPCWRWNHGGIREYLSLPDVLALVAPRPLVLQTGAKDASFSSRNPPYAGARQVAARTRVAYGGESQNFRHLLHPFEHDFVFGGEAVEPGLIEWLGRRQRED